MKNKHYNIFFSSERDGSGKSFRLSKTAIMSLMIWFSAMIIFASIGLYRVVGFDSISYELDQLREYKYITSNLLIESGLKESTVSSGDLEKIIIEYIVANKMIYPSEKPIDGYVTKGTFKKNDEVIHAGINIASKINDEIKSPLDGLVVSADEDNELGGMVIVHHKNNFFTVYKHLEKVLVNPRDLIFKDQIIGISANSDNGGSHLYFEIWKDNQVIDPRNLISDYKEKDVSIR